VSTTHRQSTSRVDTAELARRAVITAGILGRPVSDVINMTRDKGGITMREGIAIQAEVDRVPRNRPSVTTQVD
jgi:hypothetical protein